MPSANRFKAHALKHQAYGLTVLSNRAPKYDNKLSGGKTFPAGKT